ncbi:DNA polymerase III subunit tau [Actinomadura rubteroloni]|uniref:DNA polymerase III subunit gamma/tau n=1 Tax=Actinomadura rubteroloni TaxID=1926885 RepID=A0A2P4UMX8_9ACTN|nr:DNA polymerase III subunit gamma and tau [Actinomadura rubteroloni]POM26404.1 DNA polymerase III subunit tau [Actinomadura rubteroloni]
MSLALYRKYRPATFAELKGQEHVAEPLQQALRNGRINHAYLFSGPRGCGKTSSARILARSLNCEKGPTPDPCGVCDSCVALGPTGTGHIDVIEIDAASHGGVDDARDLRERAFFAPVSARFKVYIIDEAHMVTREGFNALLKLVEEPPPHLKFVFATTEPEKVIGTIRSRTHHYPFRLIPPGVLTQLVVEILDAENVPYEEAALPLAVRAGAGSARDTLSILDQLLAGSDEHGITYARAVSLLGYTDASLLDDVVGAFARRDGGAVFAAIDRVIESGQDPRRFAADLLERFRDLVILANVPDAVGTGLLSGPADEMERMRAQSSSMGPGDLARAADLLHTGLTEMRGATSPRLLLELISARILLPAAYQDEASLYARLDRLERQGASGGGFAGAGMSSADGPQRFAPPEGGRPEAQRPAASAPGSGGRGPAGPGPSSAAPPPANVSPPEQPPPAQGGDPTSSVQRPDTPATVEARSVDNHAPGDHAPTQPNTPAAQPDTPADQAQRHSAQPSGSSASQPNGPSDGRPQRTQGGHQDVPAGQSNYAGQATHPGQPGAAHGTQAPAGGTDIVMVQRLWPEIVEAVKRKSRVAWMMIMSGVEPFSLDRNLLTLAFDAEGKRTNFTNGGRDAIVRDVLKERLNVDWRIDTVLKGGGGTPPSRQGTPSTPPTGFAAPAPPPAPAPAAPTTPSVPPAAPPADAPPPARPSAPPITPPQPERTAPVRREPSPAPPPDEPPPPPGPTPVDDTDEVDFDGDLDADGAETYTDSMALIQRELGGQVIRELDDF